MFSKKKLGLVKAPSEMKIYGVTMTGTAKSLKRITRKEAAKKKPLQSEPCV